MASYSRRPFLFIRLSAPPGGEKDAIASSDITKPLDFLSEAV